jgi:hypothetical protein
VFFPNGVERIRKAIRHAPDYGENDFAFRDTSGGWVRVNAVVDRGRPITRVEGEPVLMRSNERTKCLFRGESIASNQGSMLIRCLLDDAIASTLRPCNDAKRCCQTCEFFDRGDEVH